MKEFNSTFSAFSIIASEQNTIVSREKTGFEMKRMISLLLAILTFACLQAPANAQRFSLGTVQPFAVFAHSTVTNTGSSVINGDLGLYPGTSGSITGFPPGHVNGTIHAADATALTAMNDLFTSYNTLAAMNPNSNLTGTDLGGLTLTPGVYKFDSSAALTGTLTLNAQNNPNAFFLFQIGSTLTTAAGAPSLPASSVVMINGGDLCNVFWQVGSSATIGTYSDFNGNILAKASITMTTGATIMDGRTLAENGAVTLDTNTITSNDCPQGSATPEMSTFTGMITMLMGAGFMGLRRRKKT